VVDAEIVTARPNVAKALASINADPIEQLINTHWHFDHTGGNQWVHEAGASILAHENRRKRLPRPRSSAGTFSTLSQPRRRVRFLPPYSKTNTFCTLTTPLSC
jgi:glyoxylase-like metal-dependent hydrolase (beta-lactamase superfamily II)